MVSNGQPDPLQATSLSTGLPTVTKTGYISLGTCCSLEADLLNSLHHVFTATHKGFRIMWETELH